MTTTATQPAAPAKFFTLVRGVHSVTFMVGNDYATLCYCDGPATKYAVGTRTRREVLSVEKARQEWRRLLNAGYSEF